MKTVVALALVIASGAAAGAHHSFAAYYFEEQQVTIEGVLVEFELKAPHAWVHVLAPDADGRMQRYSAEWSNPTRLARDGIDKDTLRAGDRVTVTGSPGRVASEYKLHLKQITRQPDGWTWGGGGRGRGRGR
jgi:hypothetical protein